MRLARMSRSAAMRMVFLCLLAHGFVLAPFSAMADPKPANLLVIYSNGRLLPANVEADRGLREGLAEGVGRHANVFDEFLDAPRFEGAEFVETMSAFLRGKYAKHPPDVIVAAGPDALAFCLQTRSHLFAGIPIVYLVVSEGILSRLAPLPPDVTGIPIVYEFSRTIEQAMAWHPKARQLVVVTGTSPQDRAWEDQLRSEVPRFRGRIETEFLSGLPTPALLARLSRLGDDSLVLAAGYFRDGAGTDFTPREAVLGMSAVSGAPVYGVFNTLIGAGVVGGYMADFRAMGRQAARAVNQVLEGGQPSPDAPVRTVPATLNVDWNEARRWGISPRAIPDNAVVHFREPSLWESHRVAVLASLAVLVVQTGLIAGFMVERRRRKLAVQAERQQRAELLHASRVATVGELTGAIAHEINQPLGAILSNAEAAEMMLDSGTHQLDGLRQILADIRRDDLRAGEVIRRLRGLLDKHQVEHQRFDLDEAVADVEPILRVEARRRAVVLEFQHPGAAAPMLGDRVQIQQVLINLVLNALDAVADLPEARRWVGVSVFQDADQVGLAVQDRGHGLSPQALPVLFDSFYSTKTSGMGLGLSIVRTLVQAHGGQVTAENRVDGGARFRVEFPRSDPNVDGPHHGDA